MVESRVGDILILLSMITYGDLAARLPEDLPDSDPFAAVYRGVNEAVVSIAEGRTRAESYRNDLEDKLRTIEAQRVAIRELSTPVIEVWSGVLCLPIIGTLDNLRSAEITESLLYAVMRQNARCVIIDITGIDSMDSSAADQFLRIARAVRLLGAQCFLTGIRPHIAETLTHIGVDLRGIETCRTLADALRTYVGRTRDANGGKAKGPSAARRRR